MKKKPNTSKNLKLVLFIAITISIGLFFMLDLHHSLSLTNLKLHQERFQLFYLKHSLLTMAIYMVIYILMATLSLPGAAVMTLAGGAIFGLWKGTIIVSFASTLGATLAFLVSRFLFRNAIQIRFKDKLDAINQAMDKEGLFYLFTLRLIPLFPFFVINLVLGLTKISTKMFALVSQAGMLPATIVFVNAGSQLAKIDAVSNILSPGIILSFALLGVFPIITKYMVGSIRRRRIMTGFSRPKKFDYNLVVIGAGSAGLVASYIAAAVKAKVALIEKDRMGGDCLNTGCVPSKALIRSARLLSKAKRAKEFGFNNASIDFDFARVMERVHSIIKKVAPHDSVERYSRMGVHCIKGKAFIKSPYKVEVNGEIFTTRAIIIATGASPMIPDIPGLDGVSYYTSDNIWEIKKLPQRLLILGGGPIGCELAQAFSSFGTKVTMVQRGDYIMKREDPDVSQLIKKKFESLGINVLTGHAAKKIITSENSNQLICSHGEQEISIEFDEILVALGRTPNVKGLGLEELDINIHEKGTIKTNEFLETTMPNIFCAGDVAGPFQFTHTAAHQSWYASVNALFGSIKRFRVNYKAVPWATFTDPEVARVGLNETEANAKNINYEVTRYGIDDLDRAIADSEAHGFIKVLTLPKKDKILGVTIVGNHAGDIIAEYVLAMKQGLGLNKILGTIHIYPTMSEANKYAAGRWKKAHASEKLLNWVERFHTWMRR